MSSAFCAILDQLEEQLTILEKDPLDDGQSMKESCGNM